MLERLRRGYLDFFSTAAFDLLAVYILWANIQGNLKFGLRFYWQTFYPLQPNETFLNSLVFNIWFVHLWTMTLGQYLTQNFSMFARETDAFKIFEIQVRNMYFFKWFWTSDFFTWILIIWSVIAFFYVIFKPLEQLTLEDHPKNKDLESNRN